MANDLKINVSKEEFIKKSIDEQNWMLFNAIIWINKYGCSWAKKRTKKMYVVAAISGAIFGFLAGIGKSVMGK